MARFVITAERLKKAEADALTAALVGDGRAYWHWMEHIWLVSANDVASAKELYTQLVQKVPTLEPATILVLRLDDPKSYWGRCSKSAWNWLKETPNWGRAG